MPRSGPTISHAYWGSGSSGSLSSHDYTALIDAAAHGLHMLPQVRLKRLPRMANFALWESRLFQQPARRNREHRRRRPSGGPCARDLARPSAMDRKLIRPSVGWRQCCRQSQVRNRSGWSKTPALAGRLRRAQTFLRTLGIEIVFGREGRLGQ
jgi:hypothetical protein